MDLVQREQEQKKQSKKERLKEEEIQQLKKKNEELLIALRELQSNNALYQAKSYEDGLAIGSLKKIVSKQRKLTIILALSLFALIILITIKDVL